MYEHLKKEPVICSSYPKCGRTWLRFILANYYNNILRLKDKIDFNNVFTLFPNGGNSPVKGLPAYEGMSNESLPLIIFLHFHYKSELSRFRTVFIVRGVADTLVSNYYQDRYRLGLVDAEVKEYIKTGRHCVKNYVEYLNRWADALNTMQHVVISYENMHDDLDSVLSKLFSFIGEELDAKALDDAIKLSSFDNMKQLEIENGFPDIKKTVNSDDNLLRARKGVVGGYKEDLDDNDTEYISGYCDQFLSDNAKNLLRAVGL